MNKGFKMTVRLHVLLFMKYELKTEVSILSVLHKLTNKTLGTWRVKHSHQHKTEVSLLTC